jgi:carbamoyltransferase
MSQRYLGLHDGQTSGAALIEDGRVLAAVNEERLVRLKHARGFPWQSIRTVLAMTDTDPRDIATVAVAQRKMSFRREVTGWKGWFEERDTADDLHSAFFRLASEYADLAARIPVLKSLYYALRGPHYARRRRSIRSILQDEFGLTAPVEFLDHHLCHAAGAYYASGFKDSLVVTMDGGGDGDSSQVYAVRGGDWERLASVSSYDSLGNYYAYVTALCGYKAKKHEGKITGLAAHGEPLYLDLFERLIDYENGRTRNKGRVLFGGALDRIARELPEDWEHRHLASTIQTLAERIARSHVEHWLERTGLSKVALAGGLFANVRINQEVFELPGVDGVFVFPGMTDEGLSVGAAYLADQKHGPERVESRERIEHVFFGPSFGEDAVEAALRDANLSFSRPEDVADAVADALADGAVVARFTGPMEFGPRALGHRSILYQPTDPTVQDWLNELLDRTEFMPFAPAVPLEHVDRCFLDTAGATHTARFMTITFDCTDWFREHCPGVVHVDGTARPQLVDRDETPDYWAIIDAYYRRTGLPAIINTSFNMHEEPIVCTPEDAVRAFEASGLDYLAIGPFLAKGSRGTAAVRERCRARGATRTARLTLPR